MLTFLKIKQGGLAEWLRNPQNSARRWLDGPCVWAAWLGLALAAVTPPHGTGYTVCWLKSATGLPCPGCGLTRSMSCGLRGMFVESFQFHPMGLLILTLFLIIAATSLIRGLRLKSYIEARPKTFNAIYLGFVGAFVTFGLIRAIVQFANRF